VAFFVMTSEMILLPSKGYPRKFLETIGHMTKMEEEFCMLSFKNAQGSLVSS
jgi:hypothetical protein